MQLSWMPKDYVFGPGSVCELSGRGTIELIPFRTSDGADGSPGLILYTLSVDGRFATRIAGELGAVQAEAERVLRTRYSKLFEEAAA